MGGFGARAHPSEGVRQPLSARALAIQDETGKTAVILTLDLVTLDREMVERIAADLNKRYGVERERLVVNVSHTHSGPVAGIQLMPMYTLTPEQLDVVRRYTARLMEQCVAVVGEAMQHMQTATLGYHRGYAGIAVNRRHLANRAWPAPVDHDVPILAVRKPTGELIAVVVGYACHASALNDYRIDADWPGYAREYFEQQHAGVTMLFIQNCGADANALPRGGERLARLHGEALAAAVTQALNSKPAPLNGTLHCAMERIELPMTKLATRAELEAHATDKRGYVSGPAKALLAELNRDGHLPERVSYPVQVWQFGDGLKFIALGGEVVVDYALRLKSQHGADNTWVAGYSNDMPGYIPSRRVLAEGGYEGGDALIYFGRPGVFTEGTEELIVRKVADLVAATR